MVKAEIGILGGSGFYELLTDAEEQRIETPYGEPSDALVTGVFAGREVAFLPRHGREHTIPPHRINYRANLWALHELGVTRVVSPSAVGSLSPALDPGTFVVLDQFVDRTHGRADTFYDGPDVTHVATAEPYCPELRATFAGTLDELGLTHEAHGTIVVIEGPRFSTRAESRWFRQAGWDVVGMTQYPEVALARELALCVTGVGMVTDHDAGLEELPDVEPVSSAQVLEVFRANIEQLKKLLEAAVARIPVTRGCSCGAALDDASV